MDCKNSKISLIAALTSTIFYSLNQIFNKKLIENYSELKSLIVIYLYLTLIDLFVYLLFDDFSLPTPSAAGWLILTSAVGTISIYLFFKALRLLPVGVVLTLAGFSPLFLSLLTFLIEKKAPSGGKLLLIALVPLPFRLLTEDQKEKVPAVAYLYPLATALGWAFFGYALYRLTQREGLSPFAVAFYTSLLTWILLTLTAALRGELKETFHLAIENPKVNLLAFLSALFTSAGFILSTFAFSLAPAEELPILEAILTFTAPLGTLFAHLFLGEKPSKRQLLGIFLSILLLSAFVLL